MSNPIPEPRLISSEEIFENIFACKVINSFLRGNSNAGYSNHGVATATQDSARPHRHPKWILELCRMGSFP
jgi:hypothetical protein